MQSGIGIPGNLYLVARLKSGDVLILFLVLLFFNLCDLSKPLYVMLAHEALSQERIDDFLGDFDARRPSTQRQDVSVVVYASHLRGVMVVTESAADAIYFVCSDGYTDTRPT